jgi:hypothetical protein
MSKYMKFLVALVGAAIQVVLVMTGVDLTPVWVAIVSALTAFGVFAFPNSPA